MKTKNREEREKRRRGERVRSWGEVGESSKKRHFGVCAVVVFEDVDEVDGGCLLLFFVCLFVCLFDFLVWFGLFCFVCVR